MKNIWRSIKVTFKYKCNIAIIIISAFLLALCWGANISAVYPLIQINFQGKTFSQYWNDQLEAKERQIALKENGSLIDQSTLQKEKWQLQLLKKGKPFIDRYSPQTPYSTVVALMSFLGIATLFKSVFGAIHSYYSVRIRNLGIFEIRELFYRKAIGFEVDYYNQNGVSDTMSRFTNDMRSLSGGISIFYGSLVREPLKMFVSLTGAALISWRLLLLSLIIVPFITLIIRWLSKKLKMVIRESMIQMVDLYRRIAETFRSIKIIKVFNQERAECAKFRRTNRTQFKRSMKIAKYASLIGPINELFIASILITTILIGSYLVLLQETKIFGLTVCSEPLSLGGMILFYGFLMGAIGPVKRLAETFLGIQDSFAAAERIYEIIDRKNIVSESNEPLKFQSFSQSIRFDHVSFFYEKEINYSNSQNQVSRNSEDNSFGFKNLFKKIGNNSPFEAVEPKPSDVPQQTCSNKLVLKDISLTISFGETIAIIGPSGCGKSTLLNLIPRFADPTSGNVFIDDIPLREIKIFDLRRQIGLITQSPILFNGTVRDNIAYGSYGATEEMIIEAAQRAYAHDFIINDLPDQYETNVGPNGNLLSGGQRQRISIARAILKNPKILLLDEATSQIDMQSELMFHRALKDLLGTRTVIIVTHRTGALALADRIIIMDNGEIQNIGTHEELLRNSPYYSQLFLHNGVEKL
ncbi:MAG: ABC transporter ATP-binding protein [Planctomycetia bacterium]|nr:ABC transporter ATP-binding protein [Planctomycetia bacterium]